MWKKALLLPLIVLLFTVIACEDQIMNDIQEVAKTSSLTTDYPQEVQKAIDDIKAVNKAAEVLVIGVIPGDNTALENIDKQVKADQIRSVHVIKKTKEKGAFESYIIIEKGEQLNKLVEFSSTDDQVFTVVEQQPEFLGGITALYEFVNSNMKYPQTAKNAGVQGTTFVQFIVNEYGSVSDVSIIKGLSIECDAEALRVVSLSPKWIAGKQQGKDVKVKFVLPIKFAIDQSGVTGEILELPDKKMSISSSINLSGGNKVISGFVKGENDKPLGGHCCAKRNKRHGNKS
jgi:TonB family protein